MSKFISTVVVTASAALLAAGCGGSSEAKTFTQQDKQQVEQKTAELQKSVNTLGQDLGSCAGQAVTDLISGDTSKSEKCVETQLNSRKDLAQNFDKYLQDVAPKATGECGGAVKALAALVNTAKATLQRIVDGLNGGFNLSNVQSIVTDVSKIIDSAQADWNAVNKACAG